MTYVGVGRSGGGGTILEFQAVRQRQSADPTLPMLGKPERLSHFLRSPVGNAIQFCDLDRR
jgi:hypothetical protein